MFDWLASFKVSKLSRYVLLQRTRPRRFNYPQQRRVHGNSHKRLILAPISRKVALMRLWKVKLRISSTPVAASGRSNYTLITKRKQETFIIVSDITDATVAFLFVSLLLMIEQKKKDKSVGINIINVSFRSIFRIYFTLHVRSFCVWYFVPFFSESRKTRSTRLLEESIWVSLFLLIDKQMTLQYVMSSIFERNQLEIQKLRSRNFRNYLAFWFEHNREYQHKKFESNDRRFEPY